MLKRWFLLGLPRHFCLGCTATKITNRTPLTASWSVDGLYPVEARWDSNQRAIRKDSFRPSVIVGAAVHPDGSRAADDERVGNRRVRARPTAVPHLLAQVRRPLARIFCGFWGAHAPRVPRATPSRPAWDLRSAIVDRTSLDAEGGRGAHQATRGRVRSPRNFEISGPGQESGSAQGQPSATESPA